MTPIVGNKNIPTAILPDWYNTTRLVEIANITKVNHIRSIARELPKSNRTKVLVL
jgi:hypothetical protein